MATKVVFEHSEDPKHPGWAISVENAEHEQDARDAFVAVALSCQLLPTKGLFVALVNRLEPGKYEIVPGVIQGSYLDKITSIKHERGTN